MTTVTEGKAPRPGSTPKPSGPTGHSPAAKVPAARVPAVHVTGAQSLVMALEALGVDTVSYTHLTLPTIYSV